MKRVKRVWNRFISHEVAKEAIINAAKGKRKYRKVRKVLADVDGYAEKLCQLLRDNLFVPSPYVTQTMKTEYGKEREIYKLPFYPDRCVQHMISIIMRDRWVKALTDDTYACIVGRGIVCKNRRYSMSRKIKKVLSRYKKKVHPKNE